MAIRKRHWRTPSGAAREAWLVEYADAQGVRRAKTFARKRDADAYFVSVSHDVRRGVHTAESTSSTVAAAGAEWLRSVRSENREASTLAQYQQHLTYHIDPRLGREKLATLTAPMVEAFWLSLLESLSRSTARKVLVSLKAILSYAQRRGEVAQNVAAGIKIGADNREAQKAAVGIDIPAPGEIKRMLAAMQGNFYRPLLVTAIFTGMRVSELRGLPWANVDLVNGVIHVRQCADRYNKIGRPKSCAGTRAIPVGPMVVNTLREWKLACPPNKHGLVFPSPRGLIPRLGEIVRAGLIPVELAAGVVTPEGKAKYPGMHSLRHFYASWCINRKAEGGLELSPKLVQARLGHANIALTMDVYGHLFPRNDDGAELVAAERLLLT